MALETVSEVTHEDLTGYDQTTAETVTITTPRKEGEGTRLGLNTRDLADTTFMEKTSGFKTHLAFNLVFKITITNRTPFDPNCNC